MHDRWQKLGHDHMSIFLVAAFACLLAVSRSVVAETVIDTQAFWNGPTIAPFGNQGTQTMGQTLRVPMADSNLVEFSFFFDDRAITPYVGSVLFGAYVASWSGSQAIGPILYDSGLRSSTNNGGKDGMERFDFDTGGIQLVGGSVYVVFLSSSQYVDDSLRQADLPFLTSRSLPPVVAQDAYPDGNFVFFNNDSDFGLLFESPWSGDSSADHMFVAKFLASPIPLPGSAIFLGSAILCTLLTTADRVRGRFFV